MNNKVKKKKMMMKGEEMKERHRRSGWALGRVVTRCDACLPGSVPRGTTCFSRSSGISFISSSGIWDMPFSIFFFPFVRGGPKFAFAFRWSQVDFSVLKNILVRIDLNLFFKIFSYLRIFDCNFIIR